MIVMIVVMLAVYSPQLRQAQLLEFEAAAQAERMPDVLRAESYAFVALPAEVFWSGEVIIITTPPRQYNEVCSSACAQVNEENINRGYLCPLAGLPTTGWVHGITLFSRRAEAIAAWMSGLEIGD